MPLVLVPAVASAEWVAGGYLGGTTTLSNSLVLSRPAVDTRVNVDDVHYRSRSFEAPLYYGFRVARFFGRFGIEGEFIHLKVYARGEDVVPVEGRIGGTPVSANVRLDSVIERFSISHGLNYVLVNAALREPIGSGHRPRGWLTVRGGAGPTIPHGESRVAGRDQEQYSWGSTGLHASVEGEFRVGGSLYALAEYKLTTAAPEVAVDRGTIHARFTTHHIAAGLAWHP